MISLQIPFGVSYNGSTLALGACSLGSIPGTPTKERIPCGRRITALPHLSKVMTGVRLPLPAPTPNPFHTFQDGV